MKPGQYIQAKLITLCAIGIGAVAITVIMLLLDTGVALIVSALGILAVITVLWLFIGYYFTRRRLRYIQNTEALLKELYLLGEVLSKPKSESEYPYYEVMKRISRAAVGEIEKARRERDDYCSYVESWIHEVKTPLTACSLILDNGGDPVKLRREILRADNLTESILYYARLKTSEKDILIRDLSVREVVDTVLHEQMQLLISAGVSVSVDGDFTVASDRKAISFILKQLLLNASKYCGGCHIDILAEGGVLTVTDNGIGILPQELPRVFERGFTGTNGRKLGNSTGMGLYLVKNLCTQLSVEVSVTSAVGRYTRFTFSFPHPKNLTEP